MSTETSVKPARRIQRYVVGRVDEFPTTGRLIVQINDRSVGVFRIRGEYFAILNRCPHLAGPLCVGQVLNEIQSTGPGNVTLNTGLDLLACPWHNWEFDIRTGQSYWDPENLSARRFGVEVEPGESVSEQVLTGSVARIPGPYKAETIEVGVESEYIVISLKAGARASGTAATTTLQSCAIEPVVPTSAHAQATINDRVPAAAALQTENGADNDNCASDRNQTH